MLTFIKEKMKKDEHIAKAIRQKRKRAYKRFFLFSAGIVVVAVTLGLLAQFRLLGWLITLLCTALVIALLLYVLVMRSGRGRVFCGKIAKMETEREIVPRKGSGAVFGTSHKYALDEVYELYIAVQNEEGATEVIICPPQYEKLLEIGDTLLCHSLLPYPAHLSNPTKCICMHCGTMQSAENKTCITCGAEIYSLHTVNE